MAEAFLQIVLENLNSLIQDEIGLIMGVDEEMQKLISTFTTIQAVLEDAEEKQLESKPLRDWLCKLNDLVYEIDDILDECATHVSKLKLRGGKLSHYSVKKILFRHNIGRRMKNVAEKLDAVAAERAKFHLQEMAVDKPREVAAARETGSILNESYQVYGRVEDKEKMVDILVNHARENREITILPIIGVGGLGKTTLAQMVFNEQQVVGHFDKKLWICVSDDFDLKTLVKAMIESATGSGSASDLVQLDTLQRRLWELLNQKRYLLVLDDVWNTDQEKWFLLKNILTCGSKGTSIIVTTRLRKVADIMGTLPAHCLTGLSEEHCWMPSKIGELTCLKTLCIFIVGHLELNHLERVETYTDAKKANLVQKKDLGRLRLAWKSDNSPEHREDKDEKVLEALQPHPNLETLRIKGFSRRCSPIWMEDSTLEKIEEIELVDCPNWSRLTKLGELPHLRVLRLEKLAVEYIVEDGSPVNIQFPSLETLKLSYLPHLKGLLKEQVSSNVFPKLVALDIDTCSSLILPKLSSFQKLHIKSLQSCQRRLNTSTTLKNSLSMKLVRWCAFPKPCSTCPRSKT